MSAPIHSAVESYQKALANLDDSQADVSPEVALKILWTREALHQALGDPSVVSPETQLELMPQIMQLDKKLKQEAYRILAAIDLVEYRASWSGDTDGWWWHLETSGEAHPQDRRDWFFKSGTALSWTVSLGLLAEIAKRFLQGGVGWVGASAVALPGLLTLLQAKSAFTQAGEEGFEKFLTRFKPHWREEARCLSVLLLMGSISSLWLALPAISGWYNRNGLKHYRAGELGSAQEDYQQAISLNPDHVNAHYNLGNLYEDLQEFEKAQKQYLIAVGGDLPEAHNNLGRLYLLKKKYPQAVALLERGLILANSLESDTPPEVRYSLFKNLGWARFEQKRDEEAENSLKAAIGIANRPGIEPYIPNPGSAHCLLAQVWERQERPEALTQWQKCCQLGSRLNADEDTWLYLAHIKLEEGGKSCREPGNG
ncbi:MAG: tetratricopeptide repeat protein [Cyanobacteriota bacterium]|nr:tetratricopeptide repeat protein [Cyanobacteriota bacterium]